MVDIYGSHFELGGITSRRYGLIIANVTTQRFTQLVGTINSNTVFDKRKKKRHLVGDSYSDSPLTFDIEIVTDDGRCIEQHRRREIEKWLFARHGYRRLYIDSADDIEGETHEIVDGILKRLYMNCRFVNPEKLEYSGGVVGYKATLEADSLMFWQDATIKEYVFAEESALNSQIITVKVDTDLDDFVYPVVTFVIGNEGGDIIIANNTDDGSRLTKFVDLPANSCITMKGETNYISGQYYEKFYNRNFIRLLDGANKIAITGDVVSIKFEWCNRRRL